MDVQSNLVLVGTSVMDSHGTPVTGLDISRFHLFEDGKEQAIRSCTSEDAPVSIGLVLDTSGSMSSRLALLKQAATQFVRSSNPDDEYLLIELRQRPHVVLPFTTDTNRVLETIGRVETRGPTPLFDAVHLAVYEMRNAKYPRRAVLILSDGLNNHSLYTGRDTKRLVSEVDFPIYTINFWQHQASGNRYAIQRGDPGVLATISEPTGGRDYPVTELRELDSVTASIGSQIRRQYVLGFAPLTQTLDGNFHKVRVKVAPEPGFRLQVVNRSGYYAPAP
jgi:Ca-activated chloride channel family protein